MSSNNDMFSGIDLFTGYGQEDQPEPVPGPDGGAGFR